MRQTPTTILRERFPAGSSQTSAPELISSSAHTDAFFAFSHPTGWFRGLTCTLISEERRTCPPYSSLSQTYRTASPPHSHQVPLSPFTFAVSILDCDITSRQHRESRQFDIETLSAVVVVPAPILAESPAPTTNQAQEPCPSG